MKKFYFFGCAMQSKPISILLLLLLVFSSGMKAQDRNFGFVFSENLRGSTALFGNTLMNAVNLDGITVNTTYMNGNSVDGNSLYDNGGQGTTPTNMQYIDIDGNTGFGAGTRNSSSADLILPGGTNTIRVARLYWSGRAATSAFDMSLPSNQTIKIRKGSSGAYQEYLAAQINKYVSNVGLSNEYVNYQAYVDITDLVKNQGSGTYTVGNGAFSTGPIDNFGNYGSWGIMVVYENSNLPFNSVRVYDGYQQIYTGGSEVTNTINLTGLNVPSTPILLADAKVGIMGWEGDARYTGDFFKINGVPFSNALNPIDNPWNGTITSNGAHITSKNPNYTDQMGIDIDQADVGVGYGILPDASSVSLSLGTTQDQFFCGVISFVVRMKFPQVIQLVKTVTDANSSNTAEPGEVLTYKLTGTNLSADVINSVVLIDSLPSSMTYLPGTLKVNASPGITAGIKTDAAGDDIAEFVNNTITFRLGTGATASTGGNLAAAETFEVEFKVTVNLVGGVVPPVINTARLSAKTAALVDYVDDAGVTISPVGGPILPVVLTSFTASLQQNNQVLLTWNTSSEINSKRFDIERSTDGVSFTIVASKPAKGNSSVLNTYSLTDDIVAITAPIIYYRLKQIDANGKSSLSKIVSVRLNKTGGSFTVSPNPFRHNVNITIEWEKNESTIVKVFNVAGKEVIAKNITVIKGSNYIALEELSQLQPGTYIIQLISTNGKLIKQVVKQR